MLLFGASMPSLTARQENYALAGAGALALLGTAVALWPTDPRLVVTDAVTDQIGQRDARPYWRSVLPASFPERQYPKDWCGAFALWALHQAELALDIDWVIGTGFLNKLPITRDPQPGDIAYFDTNQHHAVVTDVGLIGDRVGLVNGNGTGGAVSVSTSPKSAVKAFYSIEPLVTEALARRSASWLLGGALLAGGAAWLLLPSR